MKIAYYIWSFLERFGASALSFGGNLVLAYLLSPADFGLVAMLGIFTSLIFTLVDCGLSDGLLRESNPSDRDFNTLFYFNLATGVALCLLYVALSPLVASFMERPELQPVMAVLGTGAVFSGLSIAQLTRLRSQLQFKRIAAINVGATLLALTTAIGMAAWGCGYWSLVALQVGYAGAVVALLLIFSKWSLKVEFDTARFKQLWKFGVNLLVSTMVTQLSQNIFAFILGKYYDPFKAGFMGQAQKLQQTPTNAVEASISSTSFVLIAKHTSADARRAAIVRMLGIITLIIAVLSGTLIGLGGVIIDWLLPEKWLPTVPYIRLMALWGLVYPMCNFMGIVFKLYDHTHVIRNVMIVEKTLIVVAALTLYRVGIDAVVYAAVAISMLALITYFYQASRITGISLARFIYTYLRSLLAAIPLAALALLL